MRQVAKLFMNGGSQAVRLPSSMRFNCEEVYISQDPSSGDIILSKKPGSWDDFFQLADSVGVPADFMAERANDPAQERELF